MDYNKIIVVCNNSNSMAEAARILNIPFSTFKRIAQKLGCYKTNQFWNKGKTIFDDNRISKIKKEEIFIKNSIIKRPSGHKEKLKEIIGYKCNKCGLENEWQGKTIVLQLDHINGDNKDNRIENLRFLCPNCHSQTPTYCGRNIKKIKNNDGLYRYTLKQLFDSVKVSKNLNQLCYNLGLRPGGGNIETLRKKMTEFDLKFEIKNR